MGGQDRAGRWVECNEFGCRSAHHTAAAVATGAVEVEAGRCAVHTGLSWSATSRADTVPPPVTKNHGPAAGAVGKPVGRSGFRPAGLPGIMRLLPGRAGWQSGSRLTPGSDVLSPPMPLSTAPEAASVWHIQHTPNGHVRNGTISAVSCTAPTACTAVGVYATSSGASKTLAEAWNGTTWAIQPTLNPAGSTRTRLDAVSCTSPTACTAVGGHVNTSGASVTFAERWNGRPQVRRLARHHRPGCGDPARRADPVAEAPGDAIPLYRC
jgi:hypothetical protein